MSARPDTWMKMYWGDYARDTGHLNAAGHGAYLMLIKHYWCTGAPIPDDDDELWRIACCDSRKDWIKLRPKIIRLFKPADGLWHHKRIEKELNEATSTSSAKAEAGKKGAEKRWQKDGSAIARPSHDHGSANDKPMAETKPGHDFANAASASEPEREAKPATSVTELARGKPPNPCLNDPPEAWMPLANWECEVVNGPSGPVKRAVAGGFYLEDAARLVTGAAGINDANWRGDWRPLVAWLTDKLDLHEAILPAIRRVAERPGYAVPRSLAYFDAAVREGKAAA